MIDRSCWIDRFSGSDSTKSYNEPSMTALSNSLFKPSVQAQSISALEMAPALQKLMGQYASNIDGRFVI